MSLTLVIATKGMVIIENIIMESTLCESHTALLGDRSHSAYNPFTTPERVKLANGVFRKQHSPF